MLAGATPDGAHIVSAAETAPTDKSTSKGEIIRFLIVIITSFHGS
jgi:hypothetical protein